MGRERLPAPSPELYLATCSTGLDSTATTFGRCHARF
jgi:hypothetical protein